MTDLDFPDALQPQYRMHWYTIERVLGQGGFGITYLARDTNLDHRVAIKEYLPVEVAARRPDGVVQSRGDAQRERYRWGLERFIQEARTLARFDHPNIVRVHSVFEFNGTAYMVMRFEEGENLGELLERRGTLPERDLLRILLPVLDGLELVHNAGFIHRDIKPDNIHIRADGSPVLLDFGSARHALGKARTLTILVAPGYAPFEQYHSSSENQGPWTDIYGLGATCYRAIAGTAPLDAIARSKGILGSTQEVLVPAGTIGAGRYSGRLLAAIDHALAFDEKARPQSVSEWRRELTEASVAPATSVAQSSPPAGLATPRPPAVNSAEPSSAVRAPAPGMRAPIAWAIAGAVAGAIAIAVFLRMENPRRAQEQQLAESKRQLEQERKRLVEERKRDEAKRREEEQSRKHNEEQRKEEEARRRQEEQARQALQQAQDEAKRKKEQLAQVAEQKRREQEALRQKERKRADELEVRVPKMPPKVDKPASPAVASADSPADAERGESPAVKPDAPKRSPQVELLARGDDALARGDYATALEILRPLAESGHPAAQLRMGELYAGGLGVKRNPNQAYIWYSLAAQGGSSAAKAGRARMAAELQPVEIRQADRLVDGLRAR